MRNLVLVIPLVLTFISTALSSNSEELGSTRTLFEEAERVDGEKYAPHLVKEARSFYERTKGELANGNYEKARGFETISQIRIKTAISIARRNIYENEIKRLQSEIKEANSEKQTHEAELRENVSKLKEIKDRVLTSQERVYSIALNKLEKAAEKIKAAEDVSAQVFTPNIFTEANKAYREAEKNLTLEEYEGSIKLAEKATALAERAYQDSKKKFDLKEEILNKASQVYGAKTEPVAEGVKITLGGVFAPSGTAILFDAYPSLDQIVRILSKYPDLNLIIEAYSSDLESKESNLRLSQTQAETVRNYFVSEGISPLRFKEVKGLVSGRPNNGKNLEGRRIELIISFLESSSV
jgi:outer membrane protein OmpA-like peptidoglycan-associated protein